MPRNAVLRLIPVACAALLTVPLLPASTSAAPAPVVVQQPDPSVPTDPTAQAQEALEQVEEILEGTDAGALPASAHEATELTMELRDLALLQDELPPAEREQAASYLSRPTDDPDTLPDGQKDVSHYEGDSEVSCSAVVCIHYIRAAEDRRNAVNGSDTGEPYGVAGNGIPDYVDMVRTEMTRIHRKYVAAGYRPPLPDGTKGGNARTDIYLAQIGDRGGLYGYCTSDDPRAGNWNRHVGVYGYCVLDNDYRRAEYPFNTPRQNLRVTAAHEYFHAIQFGYDIAEDAWFMEATATWAEDEFFDGVDDNLYYLPSGPLMKPRIPLDAFKDLYPYGAWIFFRHLTERYDGETGGLPRIVRQMWDLLAADGRDLYSLRAIKRVLADRGTTLPRQFAAFVVGNRRARSHYDEGRANRYPSTPLAATVRLTPAERRHDVVTRLDHLTSRTYRFVPGKALERGWFLRVELDLPPAGRGGAATVTVKRADRTPRTTFVRLGKAGNRTLGGTRIPFTRGRVQWVEVALVNTSSRYKCNAGTGWRHTCRGKALDDDRRQVLEVAAVRR